MSDKKLYLEVQMFETVNGIDLIIGEYLQEPENISSIAGDVDGLEEGEYRTFVITTVWMTEDEYNKIPEFTGF